MTEGLITRIGRWIDHHWETKATESMVLERWNNLENASIKDKVELLERIEQVKASVQSIIENPVVIDRSEKEITDLKTRLEKIELYSGMTRKVDPTKPPVVKSAFQM